MKLIIIIIIIIITNSSDAWRIVFNKINEIRNENTGDTGSYTQLRQCQLLSSLASDSKRGDWMFGVTIDWVRFEIESTAPAVSRCKNYNFNYVEVQEGSSHFFYYS